MPRSSTKNGRACIGIYLTYYYYNTLCLALVYTELTRIENLYWLELQKKTQLRVSRCHLPTRSPLWFRYLPTSPFQIVGLRCQKTVNYLPPRPMLGAALLRRRAPTCARDAAMHKHVSHVSGWVGVCGGCGGWMRVGQAMNLEYCKLTT